MWLKPGFCYLNKPSVETDGNIIKRGNSAIAGQIKPYLHSKKNLSSTKCPNSAAVNLIIRADCFINK
jgi:hypothetical protein